MARRLKALIEERHNEPVDIAVPTWDFRASGEPFVKLTKEHIGGHDCYLLTTGPGTPTMLIQTQILLNYLVGRGARRIQLVSGYLPLGRSDKDEGDDELALIQMIIHQFGAAAYGDLYRLITGNLHAAQETSAASKPGVIIEINLIRLLLRRILTDIMAHTDTIKPQICLAYTDYGSEQRFEKAVGKAVEEFGLGKLPTIYANKRRGSSTESELIGVSGKETDIAALRGSVVISLDDEVATYRTNQDVARHLKGEQYGVAKYHAGVIHGVLCGPAPSLLCDPSNVIDTLYCTDTIPVDDRPELKPALDSGHLRVVTWEKDLAEIIYFQHHDRNVRGVR